MIWTGTLKPSSCVCVCVFSGKDRCNERWTSAWNDFPVDHMILLPSSRSTTRVDILGTTNSLSNHASNDLGWVQQHPTNYVIYTYIYLYIEKTAALEYVKLESLGGRVSKQSNTNSNLIEGAQHVWTHCHMSPKQNCLCPLSKRGPKRHQGPADQSCNIKTHQTPKSKHTKIPAVTKMLE